MGAGGAGALKAVPGRSDDIVQTLRRVERWVARMFPRDAEDAVQEAATRAVRHGVDPTAEPWLRTVATRVAIDSSRRRREIPSGAGAEIEKFVREHDGNPEGAVLRAERADEVRRALASISPRYRHALVTYMEEESPAAVAVRLGLSSSAAWTLLSRARSSLRTALERAGFAPAVVFVRAHWRVAVTGAAAAGVAASLALVPPVTGPQPGAQMPRGTAASARAVQTSAGASAPAAAPSSVAVRAVDSARAVVRNPAKVPVRYHVNACVTQVGDKTIVQSDTWIEQSGPHPGVVASAVPEPVQKAGVKTCA